MAKLILWVTILVLSKAIQDMSLDIESCEKTCYQTYNQSGYTSGYARYKCCLGRNKKLGDPVQESSQPASHLPVESAQAHFSCDTDCISSYQAVGYSTDISVKECCFYSSLRASRYVTQLEAIVDPSSVNPLSDPAAGSDPKSTSDESSSPSNTTESDTQTIGPKNPNGELYGCIVIFSILGVAVLLVVLRSRYPRFFIPFCRICDVICMLCGK
jgi:hypothetical protein